MNKLNKNSIYLQKRISTLILTYLNNNGVDWLELPSTISIKEDLIIELLHGGYKNAIQLADSAIRYAFDQKYYLYYEFEKDIREKNNSWITDYNDIVNFLNIDKKLNNMTLLDVGCNDGRQLKRVLTVYKELYLVDIGTRALDIASHIFPNSISLNVNAENLVGIKNESIDLYLSFRTYNSSFFDINKAIKEAHRVLKLSDAFIIISIPMGFVNNDNSLILGLKPPHKNYLSTLYPYELAGHIINELNKYNFKDIHLKTSFYELFLYATRK